MHKNTLWAVRALYLLALMVMFYEFSYKYEFEIQGRSVLISSILFGISLLLCIIHSIKTYSVSVIWTYSLILIGPVVLPIYLMQNSRKKNEYFNK